MSSKILKIFLLAVVLLLLLAELGGAQSSRPAFTEADRTLVNSYYKEIHARTAPGSIDRTEMPLAVEQSLVAGGRVPLQYEKKLQRVPDALRSRLSLISGDYEYYMLGKHVLLVHKRTLDIADAVRNAGWDK
jgi:hypothetical protein